MNRTHRRLVAWLGILGIAFAQLAVTAHACVTGVPGPSAAAGAPQCRIRVTAGPGCKARRRLRRQGNACEVQCADGAPSAAAPDLPPVALAVAAVAAPACVAAGRRARMGPLVLAATQRSAAAAAAVLPPSELTFAFGDAARARAPVRSTHSWRSHAVIPVPCPAPPAARAAVAIVVRAPRCRGALLRARRRRRARRRAAVVARRNAQVAVAQSQQLVSQRAMVDAAREMVVPAGELPDPKLKVGVENVPTEGADAWSLTRDFMTMSKIGLMQEFPRAEKRQLKVGARRTRRRTRRRRRRVDDARRRARRRDGVVRAALRGGRRARDRRADRRGRAQHDDRRRGVSRRQGAAERAHRRAEHGGRPRESRDRSRDADEARADHARTLRRRRRPSGRWVMRRMSAGCRKTRASATSTRSRN